MNKQTTLLIGALLVLAAVYVAKFTDGLKHKDIQIHFIKYPGRADSVIFILDKPVPVTSVKVVAAEEAKTNKYPHALWHMVPQASPVVLSNFAYGVPIPGMVPKVSTALPEPLEPGTDYSLLVEASGSIKGEKSFSLH